MRGGAGVIVGDARADRWKGPDEGDAQWRLLPAPARRAFEMRVRSDSALRYPFPCVALGGLCRHIEQLGAELGIVHAAVDDGGEAFGVVDVEPSWFPFDDFLQSRRMSDDARRGAPRRLQGR